MYAISSYNERVGWLNTKHGEKQHSATVSSKLVLWLTYLPWAEVKRSGERGAAISLPLPFRARALESAAVASRIMDADRNGAVFTSTASSTASRKPATFRLEHKEGHSLMILIPRTTMSAIEKPVSFREDSWIRHPPRSYLGNKANLCCPVLKGLIPPLGYCIRSPTSALNICRLKVEWWITMRRLNSVLQIK